MDVAGARNLEQSGPFIGLAGMAVAAFLYGYSAVALPSVLHSVLMPLLWLLLLALSVAWFTRHPYRLLVLPVVAVAAWFALLLGLGAST